MKKPEKNNNQIQIKNLISKIHIKNKDFDKAEEILIELTENYKNLELGYLNLSDLYVVTKELDKGINIIKKGLSLFPNFIPFYKNLATIYKNNGQLNKALEIHLQIIKKNVINISRISISKGCSFIDKFHYYKRTEDNRMLALPYGNLGWIDDSHWRNYTFNWLRTLHGGVAPINWYATSFK